VKVRDADRVVTFPFQDPQNRVSVSFHVLSLQISIADSKE
jgi:hypothetical protein